MLRSGLQLEKISETNKLPLACNRLDATRKRAVKIMTQEHEGIMEEAGRHNNNRHEFDEDEDSNEVEDGESGCKVESDDDDNSLHYKNLSLKRLVCSRGKTRHHRRCPGHTCPPDCTPRHP